MGLLTAAAGTKSFDRNRIVRGPGYELGHSLSPSAVYKYYEENKSISGYSPIRSISSRFQKIEPYAIDANGKTIENVPVINAIYRPNKEMSALRFREALAVTTLALDEVRLLVWRKDGDEPKPGGELTPDNIIGFTFLEGCSKVKIGGRYVYQVVDDNGQMTTYEKSEVITLTNGVNPHKVNKGLSPATAAKKWARIEDYIADYQTGFFENGAVPAGQFVITAPTPTEYHDIVNSMKEKHRGAGNNNNISYAYDPIDPNTGKGAGASIQWIPYNTTNKNLDLKSLFDQVNEKLESSYRVPAFIQGIDDAPNFATAQVSERNFVANNIEPFALGIWSQFTHELNRITGGLGVAITFDLEIPSIAEEDKMKAETKQIEVTTISSLIAQGFSLDSIVDALELSNGYKNLVVEDKPAVIVNDKPQVDEGGEVDSTPSSDDTVTAKAKAVEVSESKNPKAKRTLTKAAKDRLTSHKSLTPKQRKEYEERILQTARKYLEIQIEDALKNTKAVGEANIGLMQDMTEEVLATVVLLQQEAGQEQYETGIRLVLEAGFSAPDAKEFVLSQGQKDRYRQYLSGVVNSYTDDTANSIRGVLARATDQEWTRAEIEKNLMDLVELDDYRAERLAVSEVSRSGSLASVNAMEQIKEEADIEFETSMESTTGDPCPYCEVRIGEWYPVGAVQVPKGAVITGSDGTEFVNSWDDNEGHDIHANGKCVPVFRVVGSTKSVAKEGTKDIESEGKEIHCEKCKRFLGKSTGSVNAVIKCSNSKCKHDNTLQIS